MASKTKTFTMDFQEQQRMFAVFVDHIRVFITNLG